MTWVEHSLVGTGIYVISRGIGKRLSLSMLLIGSTILLDIDHLWFRIGAKTVLLKNTTISLGFWLSSDTWTHSFVYLLVASVALSYFFEQRKRVFYALLCGGLFHLLGDWLYRQLLFDMGIMWFWPFSWRLF